MSFSTQDVLVPLVVDGEDVSEKRTRMVVRLRRSFWHDNDGVYQRIGLRYLKRHTEGFNVFDDECHLIGASEVLPKVLNLNQCPDGIYQLVLCNAHRDYETGHVEDWDYRLVPFNPKARETGNP